MTSLFVPVDKQFTTLRIPFEPEGRGYTEILCDLEGLVRILCANALWGRDTILEVRSANRVKQRVVPHTALRRFTDWYSCIERKRRWPAWTVFGQTNQ